MAVPIWKDIIYTLSEGVAGDTDFNVQISGVTIYAGYAYARPDSDGYPRVRVNDILADKFKRGLTFLGMEDTPAINYTLLYDMGRSSYADTAFADWSYDPDYNPDLMGMNFPICDILIPGQRVPCTGSYGPADTEWVIHMETPTGDFNMDFNSDFLIYGTEVDTDSIQIDAFHTAWLNLRGYPSATEVRVTDTNGNTRTYRVGGGCKQYALYYVNAYGGWDTLAVLGNTKVRDTLKRYTTEQVYDNTQTYNRGKVNYVNEVTRAFTFNTHPLNEDQASRMHHLLNSPHVYLHDVLTDHVYPIVLTGNTTEHSKGPGLHSYTIEAELAQTRIRR